MTMPTATYRLQMREGMDFDRAAGLVPYLAELGISHLYLSPVFTATAGSTHGYDVTDPAEVEPAIGGRAGLERLSTALTARGMGLILDIVPNHMAFAPETPWLRDVLRHGSASRYAGHFDLDPAAPRLLLPWLPAPFAQLADEGALTVEDDPDGPVLVTGGLRIPLGETPALDAARRDPAAIPLLHDEQAWQATHWRTEMDAISHRRFFNITGLIGVRVEVPRVFEDVHRLLFELIEAGLVQGVRVDHVDGLADPAGYLERLRARLPDVPIWVEKILTGDEEMPDWPVEGTTGYEAARQIGRALTDDAGLAAITELYRQETGRTASFHEVLEAARQQIVTTDLAAELGVLCALARAVADTRPDWAEIGPEALRQAMIAFLAAFPRYRTYATGEAPGAEDAALLTETAERAASMATGNLLARSALDILGQMLVAEGVEAMRLRTRLQQVTGAAAAKSLEDTAFYREVRLLHLNEVGGEPNDDALPVEAFSAWLAGRAERMPHGLTLSSSHDTKRSEDARAQLIAASHQPDDFTAWFRAVADTAPEGLDPNIVWYVAQCRLALGAEPEAGERLAQHAVKALREAKEVTFHTEPDDPLERQVTGWARALGARACGEFAPIERLERAAEDISLAQVAIKLLAPGIPDIYQGTEAWTASLSDPDNRRQVDFDRLERALRDPSALDPLSARKFDLTRRLLRLRADRPDLFAGGDVAFTAQPGGGWRMTRSAGGATVTARLSLHPAPPVPGDPPEDGTERIWPEDDAPSPVRIDLEG